MIESEVGASHFSDERLAKRFNVLPAACEVWANTKAAYRFL